MTSACWSGRETSLSSLVRSSSPCRCHSRRFLSQGLAGPGSLDAWTPAYIRSLRPRLLLGRFEAPEIDWWRDVDPRTYSASWGGEPAAARLTRFLKPGTLTLYADALPSRLIAERKLTRDDAGRVEIRKRFWHFEEEAEKRPETVPPVLVYADLQASGDARSLEAAERVFGEAIDGLIRQHVAHRPG